MSEGKTVKVEMEIPGELWKGLTWYCRRTSFWVSDDYEGKAVNAMIVCMLERCMESEKSDPVMAIDQLRHIVKEEFALAV